MNDLLFFILNLIAIIPAVAATVYFIILVLAEYDKHKNKNKKGGN